MIFLPYQIASKSARCVVLLAMALLLSNPAAMACTGKVVGVTDGDTIKALCDGEETRVRLSQIDAPERSQPFGAKAKEALSTMVFGRTVRLEITDTDRYGRQVATVWIQQTNINREMVRAGFAWAYRKYLRDESLIDDEARARAAKKGLWADKDPIAPWEFRRVKRESKN